MSSNARAERLRVPIYIAGAAVFAVATAYLAMFALKHWAAIRQTGLDYPNMFWMVTAGGAYAASVFSTALAWPAILRSMGRPLSLADALPIGLAAQSGKYLPGNAAHYIGRTALAARRSITVGVSARSTTVEFGSALVAGTIVAASLVATDPVLLMQAVQLWDRSPPSPALAWFILLAFMAILLGALMIPPLRAVLRPRHWALSTGILIASFVFAGTSFFAVAQSIAPGALTLSAAIAIFAAAWLLGFVVPGAPAGLGVREAVLVLLTSTALTPPVAFACAMLHRLLSALVDGVMALVGMALLVRGG